MRYLLALLLCLMAVGVNAEEPFLITHRVVSSGDTLEVIYSSENIEWAKNNIQHDTRSAIPMSPSFDHMPSGTYYISTGVVIIKSVTLIDGRIEVLCEEPSTWPPRPVPPTVYKDIYVATCPIGTPRYEIIFSKRLYRKEVHTTVTKEVDEISYEWEERP